jgi:CheY-like chemotaxis protein
VPVAFFSDPGGSSVVADPETRLRPNSPHDRPIGPTSRRSQPGLSILLVEPDADTADSTALLLRLHGHRVLLAPDGPCALQEARDHPPDVIVLEIHLPGLDGWQLAGQFLREVNGKRPFLIALTGCGEEADRRRSEEAGIDLHLAKPADPDYLRRLLRRLETILLPADGMAPHDLHRSRREWPVGV